MTSGFTIASSSMLAPMLSTIMRLRSSWPSCEPAPPRAVMRWKCTDTPGGASATISPSTVGFPGGTRNPNRALQPIIPSCPQHRAVINILELQRLCQKPLLERALDRPLDISSHGGQPERIRVFSEDGPLLFEIPPGKVQISSLGTPSPFVGDFFRSLERVEQLQRRPGVVAENAVLNDDVVIGLEEAGFPIIFEDHRPAVILT